MPRRTPRPARAADAVRRLEGVEAGKDHLALDLKARGRSLQFIARRLRCSMKAADARLARALAELRRETAEDALAVDLERVERIFEGLVAKGAFDGKPAMASVAVKLLERRAKYFGHDRPEKHEHTGKDGGPLLDLASLSDDQLRALASGILPALAGADGGGGARAPAPDPVVVASAPGADADAPVAGADAASGGGEADRTLGD